MTWRVSYDGEHVASGDAHEVSCSDEVVEAEARDIIEAGGPFRWTPVGPYEDLPSDAATWLAFVAAVTRTRDGPITFVATEPPPRAPTSRLDRVY